MLRRRDLVISMAGLWPMAALGTRWPQFRGPGARGVVPDDPNLPASWSATENVLWKRPIPGLGWSSPVVWDKSVFLNSNVSSRPYGPPRMGFYDGGRANPVPTDVHRRMVYCIDLDTGEIRWETQVHRGVPKVPRHKKNTYASETPVTDGKHVYAHFGDLATYCLDMNGKVLWSKPWRPLKTRYGYGTASSPALHQGRLYIINDNEEQSYLVALDKATGKEIWRVDRDESTTWSTPYVWKNPQRTEIVTAGRKKVRSYDLDGKLLWEISGMSALSIPTPFSGQGLLYVTSGFHVTPERPVYAIRPGASSDITLPAGETSNEYIAWSLPQGGPYHPSPVLYRDLIYVLFDRGFLTCHKAKTGEEVYGKQRISRESGNFTSSPWAYNGKIFCLDENGDTHVVRAGSEFKVLGKNSLGEVCMSTPAIADQSLLIRTYSHLYRIGNA